MVDEPLADVRDMYMAHTMFRREIGLAPALVRDVADGDVERAAIVADHFKVVDNSLHHHHVAEDIHLWPRLTERAGAQVAPVVKAMEDQHTTIGALLDEARSRMEAWRDTADATEGELLATSLSRLHAHLVEHLALEEDLALPLIEKHITAAEWGRMIADGAGDVTPDQIPLIFGMMAYEADPRTVRDIIAQMPPEVAAMIGDLAPKSYAAHAELVYCTPTPARIGARGPVA
ncbi:hemerythrin domain-containing protein [Streptomyces sp. NPDC057062]|uniref:hemerythrin domain-containing protein n=1 Tax=Streptomyces sp. NPDC057062 TaxID=3346011 RepID=UPI0036396F5D